MPTKNIPLFRLLPGLLGLLLTACGPPAADTAINPIYTDASEVALSGFDAVAYFTENKALPGKREFEFEWERLRWRFTSMENRERFKADPEAFIPALGGYDAQGMATGRARGGNPEVWEIKAGRLYLFKNRFYYWLNRFQDADHVRARQAYQDLTAPP